MLPPDGRELGGAVGGRGGGPGSLTGTEGWWLTALVLGRFVRPSNLQSGDAQGVAVGWPPLVGVAVGSGDGRAAVAVGVTVGVAVAVGVGV